MNRYSAILVALATLWSVNCAADRALVIGINQYAAVPGLFGSVNDARNFAAFVQTQWGFANEDVRVLVDSQATAAAIRENFRTWLIEGTRAGDRVVFYYSGHGDQITDANQDEADGLDEVLIAHDAALFEDGSGINVVTDDELRELFDALQGRSTTVVIDSCHSGTISRGVAGATPTNARSPQRPVTGAAAFARGWSGHKRESTPLDMPPGLAVWTAVSSSQLAFEDERTREGVFTTTFINGVARGLADRNGNGRITSAELLAYTQDVSSTWCAERPFCTLGLTPTLDAPRAYLNQPITAPPTIVVAPPSPPPIPVPQQKPPPTTSDTPTQPATAEIATDLLSQGNSADVRLELLPAERVAVGDTVRFRVTSPHDGYLILIDIDAAGRLTQIYPNRFSDAQVGHRLLHPNRPVTVPDDYYGFVMRASEPAGKGTLLAIVTEDNVPLDELLARNRDLNVVADPVDYLASLVEKLRQTWREDRLNRPLRWSLAETDYEILPRVK